MSAEIELLNPIAEAKFTPDDKIPQLQTKLNEIIERLNVVSKRDVVGLDSEEGVTLKTELAKVAGELGHVKSKVDGYARTIELVEQSGITSDMGNFGLSKRQMGRLKAPDSMSGQKAAIVHFNLVAHTPDELTYAGQMRSAALVYGVSRSGQSFGRKYGMSEEWRAHLREFHALNDLLLLIDTLKGAKLGPSWYNMSPEKRFAKIGIFEDYRAVADVLFKQASTGLDTATPGDGLEWVPTVFSGDLIQRIRAALQVTNLFAHIAMPSETYKIPALVADAIGYKMAQGLEENATKVTARAWVTDNITMTAQKIGARMLASGEIEEDSIIPIAPLLIDQLVLALGRAWEIAAIDGDLTAPHQDSDVTASDDARKLWKGMRKIARDAGTETDLHNGNVKYRDLMNIGKLQERYGRPSQNVIIAGYSGFVELALASDDNGNNIFLTRKDYGDAAVIVEGELGQIGGVPLVLSDFIRQDLNDSGVYDGATVDRTIALRVNRESMLVGDRRDVTLAASPIPYMESDQTVAVATYRGDFVPKYKQPAQKILAAAINLRS